MANMVHDLFVWFDLPMEQVEGTVTDLQTWEKYFKKSLKDAYMRGRSDANDEWCSDKNAHLMFENYYEYNQNPNEE